MTVDEFNQEQRPNGCRIGMELKNDSHMGNLVLYREEEEIYREEIEFPDIPYLATVPFTFLNKV